MSATLLDAQLLKTLPLPRHKEGSKEERGRLCIIGGSREVPGAVLLSALGAMRAGAGKLRIVTVESRAGALALAMPEALVVALKETPAGGLQAAAFQSHASTLAGTHALLVGPGMVEEQDSQAIVQTVLASGSEATLVLDAGALPGLMQVGESLRRWNGRVILTPHAGEMATLLGLPIEQVEADPAAAAQHLTTTLGVIVVMKGSQTIITTPEGTWRYGGGGIGLATSGSGDVLAGIIAGLAARGAAPVTAALWGVYLHGEAGRRLAQEIGPLGFLARELPALVPMLMHALEGDPQSEDPPL